MANPQKVMSWLPLVREVIDLGVWVAERVRARRKARRAKKH